MRLSPYRPFFHYLSYLRLKRRIFYLQGPVSLLGTDVDHGRVFQHPFLSRKQIDPPQIRFVGTVSLQQFFQLNMLIGSEASHA